MNKLILTLTAIFLFTSGCASFNVYQTNYDFKKEKFIRSGNLIIYYNEISEYDAEIYFDADFRSSEYLPLYITVQNAGVSTQEFSIKNYEWIYDYEDAWRHQKKSEFPRLILWSLPWAINFIAGWNPVYGVGWLIIGAIDMGKATLSNSKRAEYWNKILIKTAKIEVGDEAKGFVFVKRKVDFKK